MTTQAPDWLIWHGARRKLWGFPLEAHVRKLPAQPDFHYFGTSTTRGYVATWEIRADDTLWLNALQTRPVTGRLDPGLQTVFGNATGPVSANWVYQQLTSTADNDVRFSPFGQESAHQTEWLLTVWEGRLVMTEEVSGRERRRLRTEFTGHLEAIFGADEGAFLRAVRSNLADAAPKLIYADWLDERDDARGRFIRLVERLTSATSTSPLLIDEIPERSLRRALSNVLWIQLMGYDEIANAARLLID